MYLQNVQYNDFLTDKEPIMDCLFCKIVVGEIKSEVIYQDDQVVAFRDINPQAPHHVLVIPCKHISTLAHVKETDTLLLGNMFQVAKMIAADLKVDEAGYRLVLNCNDHGGQTVQHIHLHLLAGRQMHWPPG